MPPFGFDHLTLVWEPAPDFVTKAAAAGAASVSLFLKPRRFEGAELLPALADDDMVVREVRRRLDDTGVSLAVLEGFSITPDFSEAAMRRGLDVALALGRPRCASLIFDPEPARARDNMARLAELARSAGIDLLLEFTPLSQVADLAAAGEWVDRFDCAVTLDLLHLERSGGTPDDVARFVAERPFGIGYVQLCDGPGGPPTDTQAYADESMYDRAVAGAGAFPVGDVLRAVGPGVRVSNEIPNPAVRRGALTPDEHLRRVADATRRAFTEIGW